MGQQRRILVVDDEPHLVEAMRLYLDNETLLAKVWGSDYREEDHYVRLYVSYLRQKIEPEPASPRYILTEKGLGYRFVDFRPRDGSHPRHHQAEASA